MPAGRRIARLLLQRDLRGRTLLGRGLRTADDFLELRAFARILLHHAGAPLLAFNHAGLGHTVILTPAIELLAA